MRLIVFVFCVIPFSLFSQIPQGYYDSAEGKTGEELKISLNTIIKGHKTYPYTGSSTDIWDILKETDKDPVNPANVILFYTGWSVNAAQEYNNGSGWNREHVWAKSHGAFDENDTPGKDAHHLRPTDISVNGKRDSRWFDNGGIAYTDPDGLTGCYFSDEKYTWEPREAVKGDVARIIFYMDVRYEGENGEPDLEVIDYFPSNNYTSEPVHALLSTLLAWHELDPVDDFERNRNEVIYSYQENRNPFIDRPEFVELIYVDHTGIELDYDGNTYSSIFYPNPVKAVLYISNGFDGLKEIYNSQGVLVLSSYETEIDMTTLRNGFYILKVKSVSGKTFYGKILKQ